MPLSLPAGFWSKAIISTSEEADKLVVEVANAIHVNRSAKANPINIPCFLFIVTEIVTWFVLFLLIYPRSYIIIGSDDAKNGKST